MRGCVREADIVARLGGDEFAVVQASVGRHGDRTALGGAFDRDHRRALRDRRPPIVIDASVGIAIAPNDGIEPDILMKNADLALYRAKADGGGTYRFFEPEMDARMQARRALEIDLRKRPRQRRIRALLSTASSISRPMRSSGLRSAAALAPSQTRHDPAVGLHPGRRRDRPDRADRRMGAAPGLRRGRALAAATSRSRSISRRRNSRAKCWCETVVSALAHSGLRRGSAGAGNHRTRPAAGKRRRLLRRCISCATSASSIAMDDFGTGYSSLELSAQLPVRQDQDRSEPSFATFREGGQRRHHPRCSRTEQQLGDHDDCRRRRDRSATRQP